MGGEQAATVLGSLAPVATRRSRRRSRADPGEVRDRGASVPRDRAAVGQRGYRPRGAARQVGLALSACANAPLGPAPSAPSTGCERASQYIRRRDASQQHAGHGPPRSSPARTRPASSLRSRASSRPGREHHPAPASTRRDPAGGRSSCAMEFHRSGLPPSARRLDAAVRRRGRPAVRDGVAASPIAAQPKRVALLVSRYDHCLLDLLWRCAPSELDLDICLVISNHADLAADVEAFGCRITTSRSRPDEAGGRAAPARAAARRRRSRRARALHADPVRRVPRRASACR